VPKESQQNSRPTPDADTVRRLLAEAGVAAEFALNPLSGGANNRVFLVEADGTKLLLKWYFQHPHDERDRLAAEFAFCRFAWDRGVRCVPEPLARDLGQHLALYEFIEGRRLQQNEIGDEPVAAAIRFVDELNQHRDHPEASQLPDASEACFSISEHLDCVERRVNRLAGIRENTEVDRDTVQFVRSELVPRWQQVRSTAQQAAGKSKQDVNRCLTPAERSLSPSDFGFHNALMTPSGTVRFLDFEYAGHDDPAKLVCDFFAQVERPVPRRYFALFLTSLAAMSDRPDEFRVRACLLFPVYRLKWSCIALNEFLPTSQARRRFSGSGLDFEERKQQQLDKARVMLRELPDDERFAPDISP